MDIARVTQLGPRRHQAWCEKCEDGINGSKVAANKWARDHNINKHSEEGSKMPVMEPNFSDIFVSVITDFDKDDLRKHTKRLIENGSSFAVVDGKLYLSQASQDFITTGKASVE